MRHSLAVVAILILSLPLSVILTLLLLPLWRWLEATHGIESVGHSGPAGWCFGLVFFACACICGAVYALKTR